jgi:hypothetical protein
MNSDKFVSPAFIFFKIKTLFENIALENTCLIPGKYFLTGGIVYVLPDRSAYALRYCSVTFSRNYHSCARPPLVEGCLSQRANWRRSLGISDSGGAGEGCSLEGSRFLPNPNSSTNRIEIFVFCSVETGMNVRFTPES